MIQEEQKNIEYRLEFMSAVAKKCGVSDEDDYKVKSKTYRKKVNGFEILQQKNKALQETGAKIKKEYIEIKESIPEKMKEKIEVKCREERDNIEGMIKSKLMEKCGGIHGKGYSIEKLEMSKYVVDKELDLHDKTEQYTKNKNIHKKSHR